ncbi:hypothetical protein BsWGS_23422 [Bradybaena similaris]
MRISGEKTNMSENEEMQQEASLELYKSQVSQVEQAIQAAGESPDLIQLRNDLQELISLTEEHLLELKKARLLKSLAGPDGDDDDGDDQPGASDDQQTTSGDDEYAVFQAALSVDLKTPASRISLPSSSNCASRNDNNNDSSEDDDSNEGQQASAEYSQLIGTKCRAPFSHDYGGLHYGNAMIWSVDPPAESDDKATYKIRVVFINPTHPSMIPCKYFLDGNCRFSDEECRRSHGHPVLVTELKPFEEPDHSKIIEGCRCLAKNTDDVWHPATVIDVCDDHLVNVRFDSHQQECTVQVEHIVPLDDESDDDSSSSDDENGPSGLSKGSDVDDSDSGLPVYLWKPAQTTDKLGAWEIHTKGIGSKLMAKMGYITGQGLGPQGDGRAEPVPIMLLPQGKSLDKIMQLKEMSGNLDMFNAMKKLEKRQKVLEKKEAEKTMQREIKQNAGVFGFINRKLGEEKEQAEQCTRPNRDANSVLHSSERELTQRSDKEVNVQIFKTAEEIKKVERNLDHLKQQLVRNESRDRKMADSVRQKITEQEAYLRQLKASSQTLETHKERRSAHKKLTIF